ncbi:MAG: tetratricopeptide repeat protein [Acidobacteriota bacterium]|nr:tetratricopeptide repeat protein [Acidobacteriota bacterium]
MWTRETLLLTSLLALGILFGVTQAAVSYYHGKQADLANRWFQRGEAALKANRPKEAIDDLRNALSYAPDNPTFQLRLAQALAADNRIDAAEAYLLDLWNSEPGSGEVNFELAQLEARKGNPDAVRYFDNAIYGAWKENTAEQRWNTRLALFHYWMSRHDLGQAQGQLLAMAAETSNIDFQRRTQIGQLQMQADDPRHALEQFREALRINSRYVPALAGAGGAEIAIGEYEGAVPYLETAARLAPHGPKVSDQLRFARLVLASDPFEIGLGAAERDSRTIDAYLQAQSRLASCATQRGVEVASDSPQNPFQQIWAMGQQLQLTLRKLRGQPQTALQIMNFVYSAENLVADECGPLQGKDKALWVIGKKHQLTGVSGQGGH